MQTPGPGTWSESCHVRSRSTVSYGSTCVLYMYYGQFFSLVPGHPNMAGDSLNVTGT